MDLRIEKTKTSIHNAFLELRSQKPLEKITVKELCEKAKINKSTFYAHYADLYELSDMMENEVVSSIIRNLSKPGDIFENPGEFARELFHAYAAQDCLIHTLFSGNRGELLIAKVDQSIRDLIYEERPQYEEDLEKNVILTYQIYGSYFAYRKTREKGEAKVIQVLSGLVEEGMKRLKP